MTKHEAIQQLEALQIPYLEDGTSIHAAQTTGHALHLPKRGLIMIDVVADDTTRAQLAAQGWDIMGRSAGIHYTDKAPQPSQTQNPTTLIVTKAGHGFTGLPSESLVDVRATARNYQQLLNAPLVAGGGPNARPTLLRALRLHVEATCPEYSRGQAETQIRLLANAVLVNVETSSAFHGYESHEAYHRKDR